MYDHQGDNFKFEDFSNLPFELQRDILEQTAPYSIQSILSESHSKYSRKYRAYENCILTRVSVNEILNLSDNFKNNISDILPITLSAVGYVEDDYGNNTTKAIFLTLNEVRSNKIMGSATTITIPEKFSTNLDYDFIRTNKILLHNLTSGVDVLINIGMSDGEISMFGSSFIINILLNRKLCVELNESYVSDYISRTIERLIKEFIRDPFKLWLHLNILRMELSATKADNYFTEHLSDLGAYGGPDLEDEEILSLVNEYNQILINRIIESYQKAGYKLDIQIP
jgi:hypothetical protein